MAPPPHTVRSRSSSVATALVGACMAFKALVLLGVLDVFPRTAQRPPRPEGWQWERALGTTSPSTPLTLLWLALLCAASISVLVLLTKAYSRAGGPSRLLPVRPGWFVASWLVPCVNLIAPYTLMVFTWDRLLAGRHRQLLRWWWGSWVVTNVGTMFYATTSTEDGWQRLSRPYAVWTSAVAIVFGALTILILRNVASVDASQSPLGGQLETSDSPPADSPPPTSMTSARWIKVAVPATVAIFLGGGLLTWVTFTDRLEIPWFSVKAPRPQGDWRVALAGTSEGVDWQLLVTDASRRGVCATVLTTPRLDGVGILRSANGSAMSGDTSIRRSHKGHRANCVYDPNKLDREDADSDLGADPLVVLDIDSHSQRGPGPHYVAALVSRDARNIQALYSDRTAEAVEPVNGFIFLMWRGDRQIQHFELDDKVLSGRTRCGGIDDASFVSDPAGMSCYNM